MNKTLVILTFIGALILASVFTWVNIRRPTVEFVGAFEVGEDYHESYYVSRGSQSCLIIATKRPAQEHRQYFFDCVK